jgi:hypothetical protein
MVDGVNKDENVNYYVVQTIPQHSFTVEQIIDYVRQHIEIHIVSTFGDEDLKDIPTKYVSQSRGSSRVEKFSSMGIEFPLIPVVGKEDRVLFAEYQVGVDLQPIVTDKYIFYPFQSMIGI